MYHWYEKTKLFSKLKALNLPSLEYRSLRGDLIETFKICNSIYDPKTTNNNLFKFVPNDNPTRTNGLKMIKNRTNSKQF